MVLNIIKTNIYPGFILDFYIMDVEKHVVDVIVGQFWLDKYKSKEIEVSDFGVKELELLLSMRIKYLIDYDWNKLMTTLYRIDIDEDSVKRIFKHSTTEAIPVRIAKLIISRVAEKLKNY